MKLEIEVELPDGFEATGEYRWPVLDEWHISPRDRKAIQAIQGINGDRIILRKKHNPRDWWPRWVLADKMTLEKTGSIRMERHSGALSFFKDQSEIIDFSWIPEHLRRSGMTIENPWKGTQE